MVPGINKERTNRVNKNKHIRINGKQSKGIYNEALNHVQQNIKKCSNHMGLFIVP